MAGVFRTRQAEGGRRTRSKREYEFFQIIDKLERRDARKEEREKTDRPRLFARGRQPVHRKRRAHRRSCKVILDNLAARGLSSFVKMDYHVIRGLAYYTGVVFEAFERRASFAPSPAADVTTTWSS